MGRLRNIQRQLETFRLSRSCDVQELEASGEIVVNRRPLLERAFAALGDYRHRQLLRLHIPHRAFDVHDRWGTEEALLAAIRFLGDSGVKTQHGSHWYRLCRVLRDVVLHDTAYLRVWVVAFRRVQLALRGCSLWRNIGLIRR